VQYPPRNVCSILLQVLLWITDAPVEMKPDDSGPDESSPNKKVAA
jgi:hypothetical protein